MPPPAARRRLQLHRALAERLHAAYLEDARALDRDFFGGAGLMQAELDALESALGSPARPVMAVVGGAKVSTKLDLLGNLVSRVDILTIGGGMANPLLAARGVNVGKSLCETGLIRTAASSV